MSTAVGKRGASNFLGKRCCNTAFICASNAVKPAAVVGAFQFGAKFARAPGAKATGLKEQSPGGLKLSPEGALLS